MAEHVRDDPAWKLHAVLTAQTILREVFLDDKDLRAAMRRLQKVINTLSPPPTPKPDTTESER